MLMLFMIYMLATFFITGLRWNEQSDLKSGIWFFGSSLGNIALMMAILWFGGYFSDSPGFPERRSNVVAKEYAECVQKSEAFARDCIRHLETKFGRCALNAGADIHNHRQPDLSCFNSR